MNELRHQVMWNRQVVVQADGCLLITRSDAEGSSR